MYYTMSHLLWSSSPRSLSVAEQPRSRDLRPFRERDSCQAQHDHVSDDNHDSRESLQGGTPHQTMNTEKPSVRKRLQNRLYRAARSSEPRLPLHSGQSMNETDFTRNLRDFT